MSFHVSVCNIPPCLPFIFKWFSIYRVSGILAILVKNNIYVSWNLKLRTNTIQQTNNFKISYHLYNVDSKMNSCWYIIMWQCKQARIATTIKLTKYYTLFQILNIKMIIPYISFISIILFCIPRLTQHFLLMMHCDAYVSKTAPFQPIHLTQRLQIKQHLQTN